MLPTCLHPIDGYAKSAVYCLFSLEIYKYDPRRPGISRVTAPFSSLLLLRDTESQLGRSAQAALDAEEGGKEGGKEGGGRQKKEI